MSAAIATGLFATEPRRLFRYAAYPCTSSHPYRIALDVLVYLRFRLFPSIDVVEPFSISDVVCLPVKPAIFEQELPYIFAVSRTIIAAEQWKTPSLLRQPGTKH
jgi:hypothetical protein